MTLHSGSMCVDAHELFGDEAAREAMNECYAAFMNVDGRIG